VKLLQETTTNWKAEYRVPCHSYLVEGFKTVGFIREGTTEVKMFSKPLFFDKKGRTFKELKLP
jgi:hypothetical protein